MLAVLTSFPLPVFSLFVKQTVLAAPAVTAIECWFPMMEEFARRHSKPAQTEYLHREMAEGKRVFLLLSPEPVGIKSAWGSLIENLFILPRAQNRGCGSRLLRFAMAMREGTPELWIPENNEGAGDTAGSDSGKPEGRIR